MFYALVPFVAHFVARLLLLVAQLYPAPHAQHPLAPHLPLPFARFPMPRYRAWATRVIPLVFALPPLALPVPLPQQFALDVAFPRLPFAIVPFVVQKFERTLGQ